MRCSSCPKGYSTPVTGALRRVGPALVVMLLAAEAVEAADASVAAVHSRGVLLETGWEGDHLSGSWGGLRQRFVDSGVHLGVGYVGEVVSDVAGGLRTGTVYEGLGELGLELDLGKLIGWQGGQFYVSGLVPHGDSPSVELVGDLQGASNIDTLVDDAAFYEVWLDQRFAGGRGSVRGGLLVADAEFTAFEAAAEFVNSSFGWPASISGNVLNTGPAFYRSALGARLHYEFTPRVYAQAGVYDGDTFDGDPANDSAFDLGLGGDDGVFGIAEAGWGWGGEGRRSRPGILKAGGWLHTAQFEGWRGSGESAGPNFGAYLGAEQTVWSESMNPEEPGRRLLVFGRGGWSERERGVIDLSGDAGVAIDGLVLSGQGDRLGAGVAWVRVNELYRRAFEGAGEPIRSGELALEVTWRFRLTPWWNIQPAWQWIQFQGSGSDLQDAQVLFLRTRLAF